MTTPTLEDIEAQVFTKFGTLFEAKGRPEELDTPFIQELFKGIPCPITCPPPPEPIWIDLTVTYGPRTLVGTPLYKTELPGKLFYSNNPPPFPQPALPGCGQLTGVAEGPATYGLASSQDYPGYTILQIFNEKGYLRAFYTMLKLESDNDNDYRARQSGTGSWANF